MKHQSVKSVPKYFRFVTIDSTQTLQVHWVIYFGVEVEFSQKVIHQVCQVTVDVKINQIFDGKVYCIEILILPKLNVMTFSGGNLFVYVHA